MLYAPKNVVVDVIQDGEEMAFVKFPDGKAIWVKSSELDFDEHEMNYDDSYMAGDPHDMEYDRP